ncbi:MAG: AbrB/MazE/SpoVT family DNA-binding domain-containing protein [Desulfuromonadaceae bacterium]|nr:AbrB/MazE/SpoVT family DNA-binding domain-containing protein [Desulfuromonadaceae bacterium]MDD5104021.1 AbrB/MazE/SpoVT family DNA-binding domain-containing protein [Desulfuromonadaceae bacterium]
MLARKTSKNQLTLPKEIVGNFPNIDLFDAIVEDNRIVLTPVKVMPLNPSMEGIREKIRMLGIDENDVTEAVKWART